MATSWLTADQGTAEVSESATVRDQAARLAEIAARERATQLGYLAEVL
jgi:hypothetical protein